MIRFLSVVVAVWGLVLGWSVPAWTQTTLTLTITLTPDEVQTLDTLRQAEAREAYAIQLLRAQLSNLREASENTENQRLIADFRNVATSAQTRQAAKNLLRPQ